MIKLGTRLDEHHQEAGTFRIFCDDPELMQHLDRPWLRMYACERLGLPMPLGDTANPTEKKVRSVVASEEQLQRHSLVCGSSGSGKTRLALHMLVEQIRQGNSVVMLDPKKETLLHLLLLAQKAGIQPKQVTLMVPSGGEEMGVPGWNPLDYKAAGSKPSRIASDFVSVLEKNTVGWGKRLENLLANALIIISTHGLSLYELSRFLTRPAYRNAILETPVDSPEPRVFAEAYEYFREEFERWSPQEQVAAVSPVMNKLSSFLRTDFLRSLLCARRNTLKLSSLWQEQHLILVHLDRVELGNSGAQLLGGLLTWELFRTAMETEGPVPVCLSLDEMGVSGQFIGEAVCEILAIARSRNLRLLVACQHLAQLPEGLRDSLLTNTSVRAFFRLGYPDARIVASALAAGTGEDVLTVQAEVLSKKDRTTGHTAYVEIPHPIVDGYGKPLRVSAEALAELPARRLATPHHPVQTARLAESSLAKSELAVTSRKIFSQALQGVTPLDRLRRLAAYSGISRLYVHAAGSGEPVEVGKYIQGLPECCYLVGPAPIQLVVCFPRPSFSIVSSTSESQKRERWTRLLMYLPKQQAVTILSPDPPTVIQVVSVPDPKASQGLSRFLSTALQVNCQSLREINEVAEWRRISLREREKSAQATSSTPQPKRESRRPTKPTLSDPAPTSSPPNAQALSENVEVQTKVKSQEVVDDGSID